MIECIMAYGLKWIMRHGTLLEDVLSQMVTIAIMDKIQIFHTKADGINKNTYIIHLKTPEII